MLHVVQKFIADAYASVVARVESPFFRTFESRLWSKKLVSRCAIWSPFIVRAQENSRVKSRGTCFDWSVAKAGPPYVPCCYRFKRVLGREKEPSYVRWLPIVSLFRKELSIDIEKAVFTPIGSLKGEDHTIRVQPNYVQNTSTNCQLPSFDNDIPIFKFINLWSIGSAWWITAGNYASGVNSSLAHDLEPNEKFWQGPKACGLGNSYRGKYQEYSA